MPDPIDAPETLRGRHVALVPLGASHYDWLYRTATAPGTGAQWRLRGAIPRPEHFVDWVWQGVLAQYVVVPRSGSAPIALVQCCDPDMRNQHASFTVLVDAAHQGKGWPLEGALLCIDHLFATWPFRKLYLEGLGPNLERLLSGSGVVVVEEGRLRQHEWFEQGWVDWVTYALYRGAFVAAAAPHLEQIRADVGR